MIANSRSCCLILLISPAALGRLGCEFRPFSSFIGSSSTPFFSKKIAGSSVGRGAAVQELVLHGNFRKSFAWSNTSTKQYSTTSASDGENDGITFESIGNGIQSGKFKNVMVLCGAGISVSAGIPDFRTPVSGLYDNLHKYNLPYPEAIFELKYYRKNPSAFITLAKDLWPTGKKYKPTISHSFMKLLESKGILLRVYTQNIDGLESLAGLSPDRLVECHGHFSSASCIDCGEPYDIEACKQEMLMLKVPMCKRCGVRGSMKGRVKPEIVFFGEELPERFISYVDMDVVKCDLLLVLGTSLQVYPVASIPQSVQCPVVLINRENVLGQNILADKYYIDIFEEGDCDTSVRKLCEIAGCLDELKIIHEQTLHRLEGSN